MALNSLISSAFPRPPSNGTLADDDTTASFSPTTLLETFVPGYGPIHKLVLSSFGFDVTVLVSLGLVFYLSTRVIRSIWAILWKVVLENYMSEITVSSNDEIHGHLIQLLAHQYRVSSSRHLMAETPSKSAWEVDSEESAEQESKVLDADGNIKYLNFSNQGAKSQPLFTPAIGSHNFWHQGSYFLLRRREVAVFDELGGGATAFKDKELLTLSCFGRSTDPIKRLIQHAKEHYHLGHNVKTIIKRPAPKDMRRFGGRGSWLKIAERPCRPMATVVLNQESKLDVLSDINEYLSPATARWYANRGIPYRRGYLFYGPPGTGKTSLTFALAGVFGLDIHVVSLLEPTLTEEELGMLFTNLPARCIVLLEDIDTAGLIRHEDESEDAKVKGESRGGEKGGEKGGDWNVVDLTKALKKANQQTEEERKKGISLSGLLNIIDGVASHEGRVLVMTTNHPEMLDDALIRPGRVDHQVAFSNATQTQIKELFERMYTHDLPPTTKTLVNAAKSSLKVLDEDRGESSEGEGKAGIQSGILTPPGTPIKAPGGLAIASGFVGEKAKASTGVGHLANEDLSDIAREFSKRVPNDMFSPAEIQGFLLKRKKEPRKALMDVNGWVEGMVEQKRKGTKLLSVQ